MEDNYFNHISQIKEINLNINDHYLIENNYEKYLYSNLFSINFTKDIIIYEYPFKTKPEVYDDNIIFQIFKGISQGIYNIYGHYYRSENSIFAFKKIIDKNNISFFSNNIEYCIQINKYNNLSIINKGKKNNFSQNEEKMIFLILRDILKANPYIHFDKDSFYLENIKHEINENENNKYYIYDGYKISLLQSDIGLCLVIGIKNRIKGKFTVYDLLSNNHYNFEDLIGLKFVSFHESRSQKISYIDKDKNPLNTSLNLNNITLSIYNFYQKVLGIKIKDKNQPLIIVDSKKPQFENKQKYYVPELCTVLGINEIDPHNYILMKKVINYIQLNPEYIYI